MSADPCKTSGRCSRGGRPRNARGLDAALNADERTVYRDLKVLELAGVGCVYDSGRGGYVLRGDCRFAVAGLTDDELLGQATAVALTSAKGLDIGAGAGPTARKIKATGREGSNPLLADALRVTAVLDLKLADHEGHRETIRTIQQALVEGHALEGNTPAPTGPKRRRSWSTRSGSAWSSRRGI